MTNEVKFTKEQREKAIEWFTRYEQYGFLGREMMSLTDIRKYIKYEGTPQSFSKFWRRWVKEKLEKSDCQDNIQALSYELQEAIKNG